MQIHFTEDEMADFLLARGYMICVRIEEYEENVYQNRFITMQRVVAEAIKDASVWVLREAFEMEMKQRLKNL